VKSIDGGATCKNNVLQEVERQTYHTLDAAEIAIAASTAAALTGTT
jgi:hypothetical protein